jgi:hypothetical protein
MEEFIMELTKVQDKIKKESRTAFVIAMVAGYFSIVFFGFWLFLVIATAISPGEFHPSPETALEEIITRAAPFFFNGVFASAASFMASRIFYEIQSSHTPFSCKNTKRLKAISLSLSIMGIALVVYDIFVNNGVGFATAFAISYVIISITFGLLARIFEYGHLLQQESDETL